ncbi:restriction endonuclease [Streptomyces sp. NPDC059373]
MIIQCHRYTPSSTIASRELRDSLGTKAHFGADLAVFVTTTRSAAPTWTSRSRTTEVAIHRDLRIRLRRVMTMPAKSKKSSMTMARRS